MMVILSRIAHGNVSVDFHHWLHGRRCRCSSEINIPKISAFWYALFTYWACIITSLGYMKAASQHKGAVEAGSLNPPPRCAVLHHTLTLIAHFLSNMKMNSSWSIHCNVTFSVSSSSAGPAQQFKDLHNWCDQVMHESGSFDFTASFLTSACHLFSYLFSQRICSGAGNAGLIIACQHKANLPCFL